MDLTGALLAAAFGAPAFCAHLAPHLAPPKQNDPRWWILLTGTVNAVAGNYRHARNESAKHERNARSRGRR
jgi:hypothetical protein